MDVNNCGKLGSVESCDFVFSKDPIEYFGDGVGDWGGDLHEEIDYRPCFFCNFQLLWADANGLWDYLSDNKYCHDRNQNCIGRGHNSIQENWQRL